MSEDKTEVHDAKGSGKGGSPKRSRLIWLVVIVAIVLSGSGTLVGLGIVTGRLSLDFLFGDDEAEVVGDVVPADPKPGREILSLDPVPEVNPLQAELDALKAENIDVQQQLIVNQFMFCTALSSYNEDVLNEIGNEQLSEFREPDNCQWQPMYWEQTIECDGDNLDSPERLVHEFWQARILHRCDLLTSSDVTDTRAKLVAVQTKLSDPPEGLLYTDAYRQLVNQMLTELPDAQ
jgi:hypothetical protein